MASFLLFAAHSSSRKQKERWIGLRDRRRHSAMNVRAIVMWRARVVMISRTQDHTVSRDLHSRKHAQEATNYEWLF